jgi:hypothetical protein
MLDDNFALGLKILAYIHAGELDLNCISCSDRMKSKLSCVDISEEAVIIHSEMGEFYSCPVRWITNEVYDWYDEYSYYQCFTGAAPNYNDVSSQFWEATKLYRRTYDKSVIDQQNKKSSSGDTDSSLGKLKQSFNSRKKI